MMNSVCGFSKMLKVGKTAAYSVFQKYQLTGCATKLPRLGLSRLLITMQLDGSSSRTLYQLPQAITVTYMTGSDITGRKFICVAESRDVRHSTIIWSMARTDELGWDLPWNTLMNLFHDRIKSFGLIKQNQHGSVRWEMHNVEIIE